MAMLNNQMVYIVVYIYIYSAAVQDQHFWNGPYVTSSYFHLHVWWSPQIYKLLYKNYETLNPKPL
jgi:hypothetical protein